MNCADFVANTNVYQLGSRAHGQEKTELKQHLQTCSTCETEYEEMLHTVAVLESLPEPVPPPDLVGQIQNGIAKEHRRNRLAFFANPIARLLLALKFDPHPTFVNCTAMFFYLMLAVFLVKLTFFSGATDLSRVLSPSKSMQQDVRVVATSWAAIRGAATRRGTMEKEKSKEASIREK